MHTRFFCAIVCIIHNTLCLNDRIDDSDSICKDLLHLRQMVAPHLGNMIIDTLGLRRFLYRFHRNIALLLQPSEYGIHRRFHKGELSIGSSHNSERRMISTEARLRFVIIVCIFVLPYS